MIHNLSLLAELREISPSRRGESARLSIGLIISNAPRGGYCSQTHTGLKRGAIHDPDNALASSAVLPKNVRFTVPVEIARTRDAPRCGHDSQVDGGRMRCAIH